MLTKDLRPVTWDEVAGQKVNVQILKAIVKSPEKAPRSLIFEGEYGSGKTTCARIMARELNKKDKNFDLNSALFYHEYDSTVIGNVNEIRALRDSFGLGSKDFWQVVVFDEVHACSNQAQTALLKIIEEGRGRTFFISCTTHVHKVLPTIRSRSLELRFNTVPFDEVYSHLTELETRLNISVPGDVKTIIASRSGGHMRNAHMLLDKYLLIGEGVFKESIKSGIDLYSQYFLACRENNKDKALECINDLATISLNDLKRDLSDFMMLLLKSVTGFNINNNAISNLTNKLGKDNALKLVKTYFSDWVRHVFNSEADFYCGMLCFYNVLKFDNIGLKSADSKSSLRDRSVIRRR